MAKKEKIEEKVCDCQKELRDLLVKEMPICFDREPAGGVNANVDKLTDKIIKLIC